MSDFVHREEPQLTLVMIFHKFKDVTHHKLRSPTSLGGRRGIKQPSLLTTLGTKTHTTIIVLGLTILRAINIKGVWRLCPPEPHRTYLHQPQIDEILEQHQSTWEVASRQPHIAMEQLRFFLDPSLMMDILDH